MNKDELIDAIVQIEWPMFAGVNNEGGKAACQMDLATFRIMRISQYSAWGEELLESCLADLRAAQNQGRNLMTEKYARMMKTTFPDEYPAIEKSLPPLDPAAARQIEDIVACHVQWKTALDQKYPHLGDRSRPVRTQEDRTGLPSVETYTRAELQTCSPRTIRRLLRFHYQQRQPGMYLAGVCAICYLYFYGLAYALAPNGKTEPLRRASSFVRSAIAPYRASLSHFTVMQSSIELSSPMEAARKPAYSSILKVINKMYP